MSGLITLAASVEELWRGEQIGGALVWKQHFRHEALAGWTTVVRGSRKEWTDSSDILGQKGQDLVTDQMRGRRCQQWPSCLGSAKSSAQLSSFSAASSGTGRRPREKQRQMLSWSFRFSFASRILALSFFTAYFGSLRPQKDFIFCPVFLAVLWGRLGLSLAEMEETVSSRPQRLWSLPRPVLIPHRVTELLQLGDPSSGPDSTTDFPCDLGHAPSHSGPHFSHVVSTSHACGVR